MPEFKKLSIIIPVYNERNTISKVLTAVNNVKLPLEKEVILIDDGSTDGSREILKTLENEHKVIFLDKNTGKGAAVRKGFQVFTGDMVIIQDADLEYSPSDYPKLLEPILKKEADSVYGSRFLKESATKKIAYKRGYFFSRLLNYFSNIMSGLWLSDIYTCYKVFSKEAIDKISPCLTSNGFELELELTAYAAKHGLKVKEIPISYCGRTYEEGKKITWKDGIAAIWHIVRFNVFTKK